MKIHILYDFKRHATGGGTHFLAALKKKWTQRKVYADDVGDADVILINSHHQVEEALRIRQSFPAKPFIHRIDGPMVLYNFFLDRRDELVKLVGKYLSSGTVFQSEWSRRENAKRGIACGEREVVILNSVDEHIFNTRQRSDFSSSRRTRLIATSWSVNPKKGFDVYQWLDRNLDFSAFEMVFIGRSAVIFENIRHIPSATQEELARELKISDIYITASQKDPCSNALLEAMACGLPAVAYKDGGHPEIVRQGGEIFKYAGEIPALLDKIRKNYGAYRQNVRIEPLEETADKYYKFCQSVYEASHVGGSQRCQLTSGQYRQIYAALKWIDFQRHLPFFE